MPGANSDLGSGSPGSSGSSGSSEGPRSVQVLYFAALRDLTGFAEERLSLPAEVETVRALIDHLQLVRPVLAGRLASVRVALDEAFAKDSDALAGARVIALIPPVAGG